MKTLGVLVAISVLFITACSGKWNQASPDMPAEFREAQESILNENFEKLKENPQDVDAQFEVAYRYHQLGQYKKAEKNYKKVLELDAGHFAATNNLADIYEQVEEYDLSAEYIKKLYEQNPDNIEVIKDTVRILLKADEPDNAQQALENFVLVTTEEGPEVQLLISDLYDSIFTYRQQNEQE